MKSVAVIMNTNCLGGAERSLLLQVSMLKDKRIDFYIPDLDSETALKDEILKMNLGDIHHYHYPKSIYQLSRKDFFKGLFLFIPVLSWILKKNVIDNVYRNYDYVYLNGNKAAFAFFLKNIFYHFDKKVIWHLRDYYLNSKWNNFIWKLLVSLNSDQLIFVANSDSVKDSLNIQLWNKYKKQVIYNPSGLIFNGRKKELIETIGVVSMLAPWKGLHALIFWSKLYENELRSLGIKSINVYGGDIYKTEGEHSNYRTEIIDLKNKLKCNLINFVGIKRPEEIFAEIDCLIHYSLKGEPFGRVIVEAYSAGVPVISTGLGGASELITDSVNAYKVGPYDYAGLFLSIEQLIKNNVVRVNFIEKSKNKSQEIQKNIDKYLNDLFAKDVA